MTYTLELVGGPLCGARLHTPELPVAVLVPAGAAPAQQERYAARTTGNRKKLNVMTGNELVPPVWLYDYTPKEPA